MTSEIKNINSEIKELNDILKGDNILTDDEIKYLEDKIENLKQLKIKKKENNKLSQGECEKKKRKGNR